MVLGAQLGGLTALLLLTCPISMGAMMWFMGRGMMGGAKKDSTSSDAGSLTDLKAEQSRLAAKIQALEPDTPGASEAIEPSRVA
jgi:outer membrane murein-binding lipoprotein Lpp